jgi:hypothetical protein
LISLHIAGATRVIGKSQGYNGLAVRDVLMDEKVNGSNTPAMLTAWEPTPDELARLNQGAPIILSLLGAAHPPVLLAVGEVPA